MSEKPRVVVAMSGGVDSSVAAALLVQQGYAVIGMMMRLWSEPGSESANRCCTPDSMALARRVSAKLGIPFYAVDAQQYFHDQIVTFFIDGYAQGDTPNPCLICNRQVRWEFLLQRALALGAEKMATGHYARLDHGLGDQIRILRAVDNRKDQSYVLHVLDQEKLSQALFPLGGYTKTEIRQLARDFNLPVSERADSQDLCFLGNGDYRSFLIRQAPHVIQPGPIIDPNGQILGEHQGLAFYTIGQRKGLGLASPHPLYVLSKDSRRNALLVGPAEALGRSELITTSFNWIAGAPPSAPFRAEVKIRYQAQYAWATVSPLEDGRVHIRFDAPLRDITPGQAAVVYDADVCLGGGIIQRGET
jgi:tRNA-specific 2-thiouridylase